jgi:hypothetical protein
MMYQRTDLREQAPSFVNLLRELEVFSGVAVGSDGLDGLRVT